MRLQIRDDGSEDDTLTILSEYDDPRIKVSPGPNIGYVASFMELAFSAPRDCEFYAFSDHDDVWEPRKLIAAAEALGPFGSRPAAYASRTKIVDEHLNFIRMSESWRKDLGFGNALVQIATPGCTCVMNAPMLELYRRERPGFAVSHDSWLYLVATAFGAIVYSEDSYILYRQHGGNSGGAGLSARKRWLFRMERLKSREDPFKFQAREFERIHGDQLDEDKRDQLLRFAYHDRSIATRLRFILSPPVHFSRLRASAYYILLVALFRT